MIGVILTKFYVMPWVGYKYESFGAVREAGRLWWAYGGDDQRLMGFAADNTMAAFFILVSFAITSIRKSTFVVPLFGSIAIYTIRLTTSKTTMIVLVLYLVLLVLVRMLPEKSRFPAIRNIALWSFASILVPFFMIVAASGTVAIPHSTMFSILDRINNSWQLPFVYLNQLMPIGLITGCGAGCFNYPQKLFSPLASFWVPVDNFYIGTYLMFGLPFVAFMVMVFRATFGGDRRLQADADLRRQPVHDYGAELWPGLRSADHRTELQRGVLQAGDDRTGVRMRGDRNATSRPCAGWLRRAGDGRRRRQVR